MAKPKVPQPFELDHRARFEWRQLLAELGPHTRQLRNPERWKLACLAELQMAARHGRQDQEDREALDRYRREFGLEPWRNHRAARPGPQRIDTRASSAGGWPAKVLDASNSGERDRRVAGFAHV